MRARGESLVDSTLFEMLFFSGISSNGIFFPFDFANSASPGAQASEGLFVIFLATIDCSLGRLAIPRLNSSKKVTHLFVLFDLLRSVFLLKEVADFDPGSLEFVSL